MLFRSWDTVFNFSDGYAAVMLNNKYGFINTSGNLITEVAFENAASFKEGYAAVKQNGRWGYIDKSGKIVIKAVWDYAQSFNNGTAIVKKDNKYSFIDTKGNYSFLPLNISRELKIMGTLGLMIGDEDGLTPRYSVKTSTRMQGAIIVLRLRDLEKKASTFTGTDNFNDADTQTWNVGKAIMAYLKQNKNIGFIGDEFGNFNPHQQITEKQYIKVMLENMGYKYNTDFTWNNAEDFAESIGAAPSDSSSFTNDDMAKITVKFLNAKTKAGEKFIDQLIRTGAISKDKAVEAGLVQ